MVDSMLDQLICQYRIKRKIGEGGMGAVYVAFDTKLKREVAFKVLLPELCDDAEAVQRFFNEATAAARVNHPGIVEVYDHDRAHGVTFIAMKLLNGETLMNRILTQGAMTTRQASAIASQVASALAATHASAIIHRDLKPENVMLVPDDAVEIKERAIVLDFGIAKLRGDPATLMTGQGRVLGTPAYMAPERCRGDAVDHRADIYALGCILFEMLTGRPPFVSDNFASLVAMHASQLPPSVRSLAPHVPLELDAIIARTLAKAPVQRQSSMHVLAAELEPFKDAASPNPLGNGEGRGDPEVRRPRWRVRAVFACAVAAVAALVVAAAKLASEGGAHGVSATVVDASAAFPPIFESGPVPDASSPQSPDAAAFDGGASIDTMNDAADARLEVDDGTKGSALIATGSAHDAFDRLAAAVESGDVSRALELWESVRKSPSEKSAGRDMLVDAARAAMLKNDWRRAFVIVERLLASYPRDVKLITMAVLAACGIKDAAAAYRLLARIAVSNPAHTMLQTECRSKDVELDVAKLIAGARAAGGKGRWGRALAHAESAMKLSLKGAARDDAATLAALAACSLKDEARARQYYKDVPRSSRPQLRGLCLSKAGIVLGQ